MPETTPTRYDAFNPRPALVPVPRRSGRGYARAGDGRVAHDLVEVYYFGDLLVDDCVRVLALEDEIAEAKDMQAQMTLAREQVALLCPGAAAEVVASMSPAVLREIRTRGFRSEVDAAAPAPATGSEARPQSADSGASSATSPGPAASSASRRAASAA